VTAPRGVLVLTSATEPAAASLAVRSGAAGVLYKDVDPDALDRRAIRSVHDGHLLLTPAGAAGTLTHPAAVAGLDALTVRRARILAQLAKGQSNREIARGFAVSEKTVQNPREPVPAKLGVADRTQPRCCRPARSRNLGTIAAS